MMETIRQQIIEQLTEGPLSARDISQSVSIMEKEVYDHLTHIARTIETQGKTLVIHPAVCLKCGFVFKDRKRFTRPGRCPQCRETRIQSPDYEIR